MACEDDVLSYGSLNERANQLAHTLIARGVGPESRVAVALDRSPALVVALLATLKAGGAYVPLEPAYPAARLAVMLADSGARLLLTQQTLQPRLPRVPVPSLCLDHGGSVIGQRAAHNPQRPVALDDLAYVIYTSGSTGTPKGVMISHGGLANHMHWMQRAYPLSADDRVLQKTPSSFDASVWEFFAPLLAGAVIVLARPDGHQDPAYLIEAIDRHQITTLQVVPSMLEMLLNARGFDRCRSLRRVFAGGEALPADLAARFIAHSSAELVNLYGPTEVTVDATAWTCPRPPAMGTVPIGRPIDNTVAYVLDNRLAPVPAGVPGELYLGGAGLARGYLGAPATTAARFLPDALGATPGARLYRTGDLVRQRADGQLEFLGRCDQQVKIRGVRIEPGEIEAALVTHPAVQMAVALARTGEGGDPRLVAYLVPAVPASDFAGRPAGVPLPTTGEIRSHLSATLPSGLLPAAVVWLPALPRTPSGKVDREALRALAPLPPVADPSVAPATAIERVVAQIWREVLTVERVGATDNFFELGGHSLLATQVVWRVFETFRVEVPLRRLFEAPTVAEFASALVQAEGGSGRLARVAEIYEHVRLLPPEEVARQIIG